MKIKLFGRLRQIAGNAEQEASGATIRGALEQICQDNETLRAAIFDGDALQSHVRVMVNGHDSEFAQGLDTPVSPDDQIAVFPPIAGGLLLAIGESGSDNFSPIRRT
jgi:molybdopterin synthase sulfur carrier subunit